MKEEIKSVTIEPLTIDRWDDFEELFGKNGACAGCWCMYWRIVRSEFSRNKGEGNRLAMKALVEKGVIPGLLAYVDGQAVGWISLAVRDEFPVLRRSRVLKAIDDEEVWSIVCFFVQRKWRAKGICQYLVKGAILFAQKKRRKNSGMLPG